MASVAYRNVTKRFGEVVAVNDLNLEIANKEFLVLVGPSGCGKSMWLRLLAGLEELRITANPCYNYVVDSVTGTTQSGMKEKVCGKSTPSSVRRAL